MDLGSKYQQSNPWPTRDEQKVLFILDARNSFEQDILDAVKHVWISSWEGIDEAVRNWKGGNV